MDVLKAGKASTAKFRITSRELWLLHTHWNAAARRTELCPGTTDCPTCRQERAKPRGYAIGLTGGSKAPVQGLLEISGDVVEQLERRGMVCTHACGWTWQQQRHDSRPGWKVLGAVQADDATCDPVDDELLPAALEMLYRLPPTLRAAPNGELRPVLETRRGNWLREQHHVLVRRLS